MIGDLDVRVAIPDTGAPQPLDRGGPLAWALAVLIVGTVVAVDPAGLVPTGPLRWTAITVTTGVALCALATRPIAIPRAMTALWVALIGVLLIATVAAVDPLHAWIGTPDRRLGFLSWLTFPALFLAGYACTTRAATRLVLRAGTIAAIVLGAWSAAELFGQSPLGLEFADARAGGPFGQPAYLGAACLLVGPLAAATFFDRRETRTWRRAAAVGGLGAALALALSQTRAAWVGALVAALAVAVQHRSLLRHHRTGVVTIAALGIVIGVTTPLGARATSTFDLSHGTSASRFDEWRIATHAITDHPLFGVGPEGYRVVFPQEVDAAYIHDYGVAVFPDRAHNGLLDVTITGGVCAGLLYAALLLLALRHAWRGLATPDPVGVGLGVAVLAYIVQQQFLFPLSELDPIVWILIGMLVARTVRGVHPATLRARWLVVPLALATACALLYGARDVLADRDMKLAARATEPSIALQDADAATRLRPDSIRAWYVAARIASRGNALTDVDQALDRAIEGLDRSPRDPALRVLYGELLVERAARSRLASDIRTARRELAELVGGAPHDPRLRNALVTARSLHEIGKP